MADNVKNSGIYTIKGLKPNTSYNFRLLGNNSYDGRQYKIEQSFTTLKDPIPDEASLSVKNATYTELTLQVDFPVSGAPDNKVEFMKNGAWADISSYLAKKSGDYVVKNLAPNTAYKARVSWRGKDNSIKTKEKDVSTLRYSEPFVSVVSTDNLEALTLNVVYPVSGDANNDIKLVSGDHVYTLSIPHKATGFYNFNNLTPGTNYTAVLTYNLGNGMKQATFPVRTNSYGAACKNAELTNAIKAVMGRNPNGSGTTGECNPYLYDKSGNLSAGSSTVQEKVEFYFGRTKTGVKNSEHPFNKLFFENLDYGIYWYGKDNVAQKYKPGIDNPYYDPKKPTVIYVHGWEKDTVSKYFRESGASYDFDDKPMQIFNLWLDAGYNVGVFYWNQLSDDDLPGVPFQITRPEWTESKIWSTKGDVGMRWRKPGGSFETVNVPQKSAGDLFYDEYVAAMANQQNKNIQIVGHSLGHQMAIYLAKKVCDTKSGLCPNRLTLLDPANTAGQRNYTVNGWRQPITSVINDYASDLMKKGIAIELYQSSNLMELPGNENNMKLKSMASYVRLEPDFTSKYGIFDAPAKQHVYARDWYFLSKAFSKIPVVKVERVWNWWWYTDVMKTDTKYNTVPFANASIDDIKKTMNAAKASDKRVRFEQRGGKNSFALSDDDFTENVYTYADPPPPSITNPPPGPVLPPLNPYIPGYR
ncbi:hypothetical protein [Gordoniibacillus kamchatkensis]|uniref:hypothetical protein n=1 Tax=Gordoniibacillus kamchatkensis TaxID=1590651 RepID=UPI000696489A|nr:hypothetical protein [Paenibacillus sp. VKM B-2647]